jgi:predicted Zn-dependent protease
LAYSRDFEREADRLGFQTLTQAGYDVRGMGDFFGRLQQAGRVYENNAPVYLRSHPLTVERISDMQNRSQMPPIGRWPTAWTFSSCAPSCARRWARREAVSEFSKQLREKKYASEVATRYGLAYSLLQAKESLPRSEKSTRCNALKVSSPMIAGLARGHPKWRPTIWPAHRRSIATPCNAIRSPDHWSMGTPKRCWRGGNTSRACSFLESQLQLYSSDYKLYGLQAKTFAATGKRLQQHRAQAEFYLLQGQLGAAVEQLQFAQQAADGNFFEQSAVDARLRELRKLQAEEAKQKKNGV